MFCAKCGAQVADGSKFCPKCGASLPGSPLAAAGLVQPEASVTPGGTPAQEPQAKKGHAVRGAIIAAVIVILLAGVGVGAFLFLQSTKGVAIDEEHFPDEGFRNYVTVSFDADADGKLSEAEVIAVNTVDLSGVTGVADITGIAEFTELQSFNLGGNTVSRVDLSSNPQVTQVSTSSGHVESIQLPDGFDMQDGLDGAVDAEVTAGDVVVQAGEWTNDNNGRFGMMQYYNGALYAGYYALSTKQIEIEGTTAFFGCSDTFHLANDKAYWVEDSESKDSMASSLQVADVNGQNRTTLAADIMRRSEVYFAEGFIFYQSSTRDRDGGWMYHYNCLNTETGEVATLPNTVSLLWGVCGNCAVVTLGVPGAPVDTPNKLALFDPVTKELTVVPGAEPGSSDRIRASKGGILVANDQNAALYALDTSPVWTDKPLSENGDILVAGASWSIYMDSDAYYLAYETDSVKHEFALEKVDLSTNEHTLLSFSISDMPATDSSPRNAITTNPLFKDGNSLICSVSASGSYSIYRVPLEGGEAELLQTIS